MRKTQQSFLAKVINFSKKNQVKREPRNYSVLVESFKSKVQLE